MPWLGARIARQLDGFAAKTIGAFALSGVGSIVAIVGLGRTMTGSPASGLLLLLLGAAAPFVATVSASVVAWERSKRLVLALALAWLRGGLAGALVILARSLGSPGLP